MSDTSTTNYSDIAKKAFDQKKYAALEAILDQWEAYAVANKSIIYAIVIHMRHNYTGLIALQEGRLADAKMALFKAGKVSGSPPLNTFGPNVLLASELLKLGEKKAVLSFFRDCQKFWWLPFRLIHLNKWKRAIAQGLTPDFGASLNFYMAIPERN